MKTEGYIPKLHNTATLAPRADWMERKALERSNASLREQSAALERRNRELAAYAHTVAHDLKDPLSVIIATSDAIFHITDLTPEELRAYLLQIETTAHNMSDMIENLLLFSEVGEVQVPVEPLDMEEIVSRIRTRLGYLVRTHSAEITVPQSWPVAIGYGPWIEEVWANFISNAVKYGGRPPRVELGAAVRPNGMVLFWVRDNGPGITREAQRRLFQPFTQLGATRTPGHGLGLSIARRIVEKLGGEVGMEMASGGGSLFFFTLPARR